jgi:hypothetical protein
MRAMIRLLLTTTVSCGGALGADTEPCPTMNGSGSSSRSETSTYGADSSTSKSDGSMALSPNPVAGRGDAESDASSSSPSFKDASNESETSSASLPSLPDAADARAWGAVCVTAQWLPGFPFGCGYKGCNGPHACTDPDVITCSVGACEANVGAAARACAGPPDLPHLCCARAIEGGTLGACP